MTDHKAVSIHSALHEISDVVRGAKLIAQAIEHLALDSDHEAKEAPASLAAVLSLLNLHVENCLCALRGEIDPLVVWTPKNAAPSQPTGTCEDLIVPAWEPKRAFDAAQAATKVSASKTSRTRPSSLSRKRGAR